jgi:rare lipoprotein A
VRQPALALALLLLAGCSSLPRGGYFQDDGPGSVPPDVASIPDAVPKSEPLAASGNRPYTVEGSSYTPMAEAHGYRERGIASWYGKKFHGKRTSSGEPYDMYTMTAAHKTLPLPSYVRVRNLNNDRAVIVRVNDRGPFLHNRLIDLSYAAAAKLGIVGTGTGVVEVEAVEPGDTAPVTVARPNVETFSAPPPARPTIELIPSAQANPTPPAVTGGNGASSGPRLFVQTGAFRDFDNASALRTRLERAAFRPVFIQSVLANDQTRLYRVRIGPIASVEEGDRMSADLGRHGVADALIVVE